MNPTGQLNDKERRRYVRRSIQVPAKLLSEHLPFSDCEIRDFCDGGLHLTFDNPIGPLKTLVETKTTVWLHFAAIIHDKRETIKVKVKPVRLTNTGLGVTFAQPNPKALQTLQNLAITQHKTAGNAAVHQTNLNLSVKAGIKTSCEEAIKNTVPRILSEFFETLEPALGTAAENADNNRLSDSYLDAIAKLSENRSSLEQSYSQSVRGQLQPNDATRAKNTNAVSNTQKLTVVEKDEFEDWLTLSDIINKTNSAHDSALSNLEKKIAALNNQPVDESNNPASPTVFCDAFRDQLDNLDLDHPVKQQIYKIFGNSLNHQLGNLYSELNQHLQPIHLSATYPEPKSTVQKNPIEPESRLSAKSEQVDIPQRKTAGLVNTFKRFTELGARVDQASHGKAEHLPDINDDVVPTSISECNSKQILAALRGLSANRGAEHESVTQLANLETEILQQLANPHIDREAVSTDDRLYIDFAAQFCDVLTKQSADLTVTDSVLDKLRIPLLNLAAREPEFLNDATHTAWQILDMVARLNASLAGHDASNETEIRNELDTIIGEFSANTNSDPAVFESIRNRLEQITAPLETTKIRAVERVRENCAGKHQTEQAKAYVQKLIDDRIAGKSVPQLIISLLDSGWEHLLALSMIRGDTNSELLATRLNLFDDLLKLLADSDSLQAKPDAELQNLVNLIDEELSIVCSDMFQHRKIMDELTAHLIGVGQPPVRIESLMTVAEARTPKDNDSDPDKLPRYLRGYANQAKEFNVGDWLMFNMNGAERQPLNLVWKGEKPWLFVFVNRKGQKATELSLQSLAALLKHERVWKVESLDVPLSERTFSSMLQDMHGNLIQQSTVDERTGLINRKEFHKQLKQDFAALHDEASEHYLCYFEIDQLRWINRTCGIDAVESVLKSVVHCVKPTLGKHDVFAQLGDEMFGILYKFYPANQTTALCEKLRDTITSFSFDWEEHSFPLNISIGLTPFVKQSQGISGILAHADGACLTAKTAGQNQIQIYQENTKELKIQDRVYEWAGRISSVIENNRLFARAQLIAPINPAKNDHAHYEILLGIKDESGNIIAPDDFIPAAEYCGRMTEIDRWVVNHVFDWMEANPNKLATIEGFSINLSGHSVASQDFLEFTKQQLTSRNISPEKITFEITETAAVTCLPAAQKFISQIKRYGCKFSLDDFGSGFSSYAYLKNLDVDYLKIDGVFVKDLAQNPIDYAMVKSMNEIGHSLIKETIAEYVENEAILAKLKEIGVDYAQGYGIQKPILLSDL